MARDCHPSESNERRPPTCSPSSLQVEIVVVGTARHPVATSTCLRRHEVTARFTQTSIRAELSGKRIAAWWHSPMGEVSKGRPSSGRVPRRFHLPAHAVAIGSVGSPLHSLSPGTEEFPSPEVLS